MSVELQQPEVVPIESLVMLLPGDSNHNVITPFKLDSLKKDILKYGFDEPIQVWEHEDKLWIVNGHKRYAALQQAKAKKALVVRKRFQNRNEALAYSIRRNEERGQRDDLAVAKILEEIGDDYEDVADMQDALSLTERELFDLEEMDEDLNLPKKGSRRESEQREKIMVKIQLALTVEVKNKLDTAIKRAVLELGLDEKGTELPNSVALGHILDRFIG